MDALVTKRLILRRWRSADREPFRALNADAGVMAFMPQALSPAETDRLAEKIESHFLRHGFGPYAVELQSSRQFAGFIGLYVPEFETAFTPCVEIAWRLAAAHWGQGLATEGAREVVRYAFEDLKLPALVSFTVPANIRSLRVMEKLGFWHDAAADFDHPLLPEGHHLRRHVLYRLNPEAWVSSLARRVSAPRPGVRAK